MPTTTTINHATVLDHINAELDRLASDYFAEMGASEWTDHEATRILGATRDTATSDHG